MSTIPYVIEQTSMGERSYDIYSRLLSDRIIFLGEEVILRCKRVLLSYYSSHAYTDELDEFFTKFKNIKAILFNHGAIESKINYVERYKTDSITTHNLLNGKAVLLSKNGIEKIL